MPRKQLTEAQKQKTAERRARFRELVKQVAAMSDAERAALAERAPIVTVEGRILSGHNKSLIMFQRPDATIVGGFRQWIAAGRAVRKGESGLMIWFPRKAVKANEPEPAPKSADAEPDEVRFSIGYVFDVSQTEEIETAAAVA